MHGFVLSCYQKKKKKIMHGLGLTLDSSQQPLKSYSLLFKLYKIIIKKKNYRAVLVNSTSKDFYHRIKNLGFKSQI